MLFANVCAGFISSCYGEFLMVFFFLFFWFLLVGLVHMGSLSFAGLPVMYKTWVT